MEAGSLNEDENKFEDIFIELDVQKLELFITSSNHAHFTAHKKLCFAIIARIYRRVVAGYYFGPIKIDNNLIIDGNHRYIAYKLANVEFEIIEGTKSHCDELKKISDIVIDMEQDWDENHPNTQKYCDDNFLKKEDYRKRIN